MLKFIATSVLSCCGLVCCANSAVAAGGCCSSCASCCSMNMKTTAPMPDMPGMPGMPMPPAPQASAGTQYRTYSYQPAPTYYRSSGGSSVGGFRDAGFKARGR